MAENSVALENKDNSFSHKLKKVLNSIKRYFSSPANVITVIFAIFLTIAVIYPLVKMVFSSLIVQNGQDARALNEEFGSHLKRNNFTFLYWPYLLFNKGVATYSANYFWTPLYRSVLMSLVACVIAVGAGGTMAFLITRTNIPFKKFISTVFIFPYIIPSWSLAMFWVNFFKNSGIIAAPGIGLLQSLTGIMMPEWFVYGFWPTAFVMGLHYTPFAYILIGGILRNMDANLEEAAIILKASRFKIIRRITLPIVAPAIISTVLLVFAGSVSSYTVPYYLNANNSFTSISMSLRAALTTNKTGEGYVIATILMIISVLILSINNWFTKSRRSFTTVSGKSGQISKIDLKWAKWIIAVIAVVIVAFFAIAPLASFVVESLEESPGDLSTINWKYWFSATDVMEDPYIGSRKIDLRGVFHNTGILMAVGRSLLVSIVVALICGTFGILIGYAVSHNRRGKLANYVGTISFLPYLIPALSFGAIFFSLMKTPSLSKFLDVSTTGSEWSAMAMCIMCGGVKFIPFASRSGTNAMLQLSGEIEEAAIIVGTPWWKRMVRIIFPIQKSSFISGYLLPFISCMREYTLFTLITSNYTLTTNMINYMDNFGASQLANATNLVLVILVIGINLIVNKTTGASVDKGIGG